MPAVYRQSLMATAYTRFERPAVRAEGAPTATQTARTRSLAADSLRIRIRLGELIATLTTVVDSKQSPEVLRIGATLRTEARRLEVQHGNKCCYWNQDIENLDSGHQPIDETDEKHSR